jgi:alkanesulfonate monooxygenase SsuD/methylene tetrahydromethanopterin reductase-like flavin-dependent oxidoreductase (luciferase family)
MDFGVVLQTDPPASRVVELAKLAEDNGFSHGWAFDSHVLWQEPFMISSLILANTRNMIVGPMVTNPGTGPGAQRRPSRLRPSRDRSRIVPNRRWSGA